MKRNNYSIKKNNGIDNLLNPIVHKKSNIYTTLPVNKILPGKNKFIKRYEPLVPLGLTNTNKLSDNKKLPGKNELPGNNKMPGKNNLSGNNKPPDPPKLTKTNTYVHTNKDGICYMYSTFTLINNILNNILGNNNKKKYNPINVNQYKSSYFLILFLIHIYYIYYIPYLCEKINSIIIISLLNDFFVDFIYDLINKDRGFEINLEDLKNIIDILGYTPLKMKEYLETRFTRFTGNATTIIDVINTDLEEFRIRLRDISRLRNISFKFTPEIIKTYIDAFINKMAYIKDFKLYKIYNSKNIPISYNIYKKFHLLKYCMNSDFEKKYNESDIINRFYHLLSDEVENIIKHVLKNKQYVIIHIYYNDDDKLKFNKYNKTHIGINLLEFTKVKSTDKYHIHSIVFTDYNEELETYRFKNNWGPDWGYDGYGYTKFKDINIVDIFFLANDEDTYSLVQDLGQNFKSSIIN
jgi:hypothetical protein